jgi:hypothetical protein
VTKDQLATIHIAAQQVGLIEGKDRARYELMLWNFGHVRSSKDLDDIGFEDCMALMEEMGFSAKRQKVIDRVSFSGTGGGRPKDAESHYWRDIIARRGNFANSRMIWKIGELAVQAKYELGAMCLRMSEKRTNKVKELTPKEALNLIEALKAIIDRDGPVESVQPAATATDADLPF